MPKYNYTAKDKEGNLRKGQIVTTDEHQVARLLSKRELILISAKVVNENNQLFFDKYLHGVSFSDLVVTTRQLATMVESGLVLSDSIDILIDQQSNPRFKTILTEISRDVKNGIDLASALSKHPQVFPKLYISLVRAGEQSGKLDTVLNQMALNLEKDREFRARIRGAMIYPILVLTMMFIVIVIMMVFVIPRLVSFYSQSNIDLPISTKILIWTSTFFTSYWWLLIVAAIVGFVMFQRWTSNDKGRYDFDTLMLKFPIIGKIVRGTSLTNFTRTFGLLTHAGLPILDSLLIVADVVGNQVYRLALLDCFKGVERGLTMSAQLESTNAFPKIVSQMFRVGEETGKVDQIAFKLAEYFETETDNLVKNITVVIEPVILVILGVGVGFLVISLILPIYKLTTSFS